MGISVGASVCEWGEDGCEGGEGEWDKVGCGCQCEVWVRGTRMGVGVSVRCVWVGVGGWGGGGGMPVWARASRGGTLGKSLYMLLFAWKVQLLTRHFFKLDPT